MEFYEFSSRRGLVLSRGELGDLIRSCGSPGSVSVNLGLDVAIVSPVGSYCLVELGGLRFRLDRGELEGVWASLSDRDIVFFDEATGFTVIEVRSGRFYKLVNVDSGAPTLEIDGVHMHRVEVFKPWDDARVKIEVLRIRRGSRVLDVCTGLGYTAINALRAGASEVYSIEVDENVLYIASLNPWSRGLESKGITIILGDAFDVVREIGDRTFHYIVHDPPRFSKGTGELYSLEFYKELYRILKPGGRLYHYTGEPGRVRGFNLPSRVASRLREVGFFVGSYDERIAGLVAFKPR